MDSSGYRKITRRKGACLNCRQRKVRCDGAPTCAQCLKLNLRCAYNTGTSTRAEKPRAYTLGTGVNPSASLGPGFGKEFGQDFSAFSISPGQGSSKAGLEYYFLKSALATSPFTTRSVNSPIHQLLTPDVSIDLNAWCNAVAPSDSEHPLDHSIDFGGDVERNKVWPEELHKDFSSFAPIRFLGKCTSNTSVANREEDLQRRIWETARSSSVRNGGHAHSQHRSPPLLYAQTDTLEFIDLFFQESYSYPPFVDREVVIDTLMEVMQSSNCIDQSAFALLNSVLAIGCRNALRNHRRCVDQTASDWFLRPYQYFRSALGCRNELTSGQPSVLKLQALASMILFVHRLHDATLTRTLLSHAISMVSDLGLTYPTAASCVENGKSQEDIERIFWLLYSIEKPHALRFGTHSVIDDDLLVYHAPSKRRSSLSGSKTTEYSGWDIANYRYARLCSVIVKALYGHASLRMTSSEAAAAIHRLSSMLEAWRLSVPIAYRPTRDSSVSECHERAGDAAVRSDISLKYAEVSFATHRWVLATRDCSTELSSAYASSREECERAARQVLDLTHSLQVNPDSEWSTVVLPALSAIILYILMSAATDGKDYLPSLSLACGFFAKLRLEAGAEPDLFHEMSELFVLAHRKTHGEHAEWSSPESIRGSVDDQSLDAQMERKNASESGLSDGGYFEFPQDISDSVFDIASLDHGASHS